MIPRSEAVASVAPRIRKPSRTPKRSGSLIPYPEVRADDYVTFRTEAHRFRCGRAIGQCAAGVLVRTYSKEHEVVEVTEAMFQYANRPKTVRVHATAG
jgi:hypothetical protein